MLQGTVGHGESPSAGTATHSDKGITRTDIFHYIYALLHHPDYSERYAENLRQDFPRIPLVGETADFRAFVQAGSRLIDLHTGYGDQKEFPLQHQENRDVKLDWQVEAMRLSRDRDAIHYNEFLTLAGIPEEVFDYQFGNRSALEWIIDQYRVTRDDEGEIIEDPNRPEDEKYIVRLIGQVITVSLETLKISEALPALE